MEFFRLGSRFYILFTLITLVPATWLAKQISIWAEHLLPLSIKSFVNSGVIEVPTAVVLISIFFWIYESYVWKIWPIHYLHKMPRISGRYQGEVESSYDGNKYPIILEIQQSLLNVSVRLYTPRSSSFSVMASIGTNANGNRFLAYVYKNTPSTVSSDLDMRTHNGSASLEIFKKGKELEGSYYNDTRDRGRYGKLSCKRVSSNIEGKY